MSSHFKVGDRVVAICGGQFEGTYIAGDTGVITRSQTARMPYVLWDRRPHWGNKAANPNRDYATHEGNIAKVSSPVEKMFE